MRLLLSHVISVRRFANGFLRTPLPLGAPIACFDNIYHSDCAAHQLAHKLLMRVLAVSQLYPRRSDGSAGLFIHRLHRELPRFNVEPDVIQQLDWAPPWPISSLRAEWRRARRDLSDVSDELDGVRIRHPTVFWPRPSRFFPADPWHRRANSLVRYFAARPDVASADVILAHFVVPDGYYALMLGRALSIPVAVMAWGDDLHAWPTERLDWRQRLRFVLKHANLLIGCSQQMVADGNSWLDQPRSDWQVVYGGVDLGLFAPPPADHSQDRSKLWSRELGVDIADDRVLLMLARATSAKGYIELLDAWSRLSHERANWRLVMIGANGDLDVRREISRRGIAAHAHWLGPRSPDLMPSVLRASDAFVLPSHNEGLSLSVLEALATGLPTITTRVGGHAEAIRQPCEGWLVAPRNVDELTNAIRSMMKSRADWPRRREFARRAAERIGSPTTNAQRLATALGQIAHASGGNSYPRARGPAGEARFTSSVGLDR